MANFIAETIGLLLQVDSSQIDKGMNAAAKKVGDGTKNIEGAFSRLEASIRSLGGIIGTVFTAVGVYAIDKMVTHFADGAIAIGKMAEKTRETTETLTAFSNAVESVGGDSKATLGTIDRLNASIRSVWQGGDATTQTLRYLGVSVVDANGKLKTGTQVLTDLSGRLSEMSEFQAKRFGKMMGIDDDTIELLSNGNKNLDELIKREKILGTYSKEDYEMSLKARYARSQLSRATESLTNIFTRMLIPAYVWLADKMTSVAAFFMEHRQYVEILTTILGAKFIPILLTAGKAALAFGAKMALAAWPVLAVIAAITLVGLAVDDLITWFEGGDSVIGQFIDSNSRLAKDLREAWKTVKDFFENNDIFGKLGEIASKAFGTIIKWTAYAVVFIIAILADLFEAFKTCGQVFSDLAGAFKLYVNIIKQYFTDLWKGAVDRFNAIKSAIGSFIDWVRQIFSVDFITNSAFFKAIQKAVDLVGGALSKGIERFKSLFGFGGGEDVNANSADIQIKTPLTTIDTIRPKIPVMTSSPAQVQSIANTTNNTANNDNSKANTTNISAVNNITVNATSNDPQAIGQAVSDSMARSQSLVAQAEGATF